MYAIGHRLVVAAMLTALIGGCATLRPSTLPALPDDYVERQSTLATFDQWRVRGRVAIRTPDDGFSAALHWQQTGDQLDARLHGPLGRGTVLLDGDPREIRVRHGDGTVDVLTAPEQSLRQRYGWTVPIDHFRFWVLGIGDPAMRGTTEIDAAGRLSALEEGRWRIVYREYQRVGDAELPKKLVATSDDVRVTIVLKEWEIPLVDAPTD
ncbi:MAG: lipoprotein insertase outer membrane protein LolB [Pseudomonadota bacterium]